MKFYRRHELAEMSLLQLIDLKNNTKPIGFVRRIKYVIDHYHVIEDPTLFAYVHQFPECHVAEEDIGVVRVVGKCEFGSIGMLRGIKLTCLPDKSSCEPYFFQDYREILLRANPQIKRILVNLEPHNN